MILTEQDVRRMIAEGESQFVEFKRAAVAPKHLAQDMVAFANADGGTVLVGVEDDGSISGIEGYEENVDELLRVPYRHCVDPIEAQTSYFTIEGKTVLVFSVAYSSKVHETTGKVVYLRVGKRNQRLGVNDVLRLAYAKGQASYENKPAEGASFEDLDLDLVREYAHRIGSGLPLPETLLGRNLMVYREDRLIPTVACVLLFAGKPQQFVSRCGIDFLRFEGTEMLTGRDFNVVKREIIEKPLPRLIARAIDVVGLHIKERSRLTPQGIFESVPEYPPFAWQEAITNAVAHRDYSITGRSIQIRMFDDRLEVDSPGKLPGPVRLDNLARERFSRNPQIVRALIEFGYMRDVGEGIDRMIEEMERHNGCPPEFAEPNYSFVVTLRRGPGS